VLQARDLLVAPGKDSAAGEETIKEKRDRAILSTLLFHALRREELCKLKVKDFRQARRGVPHIKVSGKGEKTRYLPLHPGTNELVHDYLEAAGHGEDEHGARRQAVWSPRLGRYVCPKTGRIPEADLDRRSIARPPLSEEFKVVMVSALGATPCAFCYALY
jgi:integrase